MSFRPQRAGWRLMALTGALALVIGFAAVAAAVIAEATGRPAHDVVDRAPRLTVDARESERGVAGARQVARAIRPPDAAPSPVRHRPQRREGIRPSRVRIPAIGVDAPVIRLGLNEDGTLEVPASFDEAGWWTGGAKPGADGPAIVAGHVDSRAGPGVFMRLRELRRGDVIELRRAGGRVVRFAVDHVEQHPKDGFPTAAVYGPTSDPALRVITCGGAFDRAARSYVDNVIVFASLLD